MNLIKCVDVSLVSLSSLSYSKHKPSITRALLIDEAKVAYINSTHYLRTASERGIIDTTSPSHTPQFVSKICRAPARAHGSVVSNVTDANSLAYSPRSTRARIRGTLTRRIALPHSAFLLHILSNHGRENDKKTNG